MSVTMTRQASEEEAEIVDSLLVALGRVVEEGEYDPSASISATAILLADLAAYYDADPDKLAEYFLKLVRKYKEVYAEVLEEDMTCH